MEITPEYLGAVRRHEGAVQLLSDLLGQYRDGTELSRHVGPEAELDEAARRYEETSAVLAGLIVERLFTTVGGAGGQAATRWDDDAGVRLIALLEVDATVVRYATVLITLRDPEGAGHLLRAGPLRREELAALGAGVAQACAPAFADLRRESGTAVPPAVRSTGSPVLDVQQYFDAILDRAAAEIIGTIASGLAWEQLIGHALMHAIGDLSNWLPAGLRQDLTPLRRLLVRGWRQALSKVSLMVGPDAASVGQFVAGIFGEFLPDAEEWGVAATLRRTLRAGETQEEAQKLVDDNPRRAPQVTQACEKVNTHHAGQQKAIRLLNAALPGCHLLPGPGLPLQVIATALLLIYEVWLAHDHLDSPVMENRRLRRNVGLLREIRTVVA
jgi:hypothetical protein